MLTTMQRTRLEVIKVELDALYHEIKARPAAAIEQKIADDAAQLIDVPGMPRFPFESLIMFRMTDADKLRERALISEWNDIARVSREQRARKVQARKNAREIAATRAAACPSCFATHAGEC